MRGLSLLEVVVALALAALVLPLLLNLVPSSALALKRAEDVNAASAYGARVLEQTRAGGDRTVGVTSETIRLNNTDFLVTCEIYAVDGYPELRDVVVRITGPRRFAPIRIATRLGGG